MKRQGSPRAIDRDDRKLLAIVDGSLADGAARAGTQLACRPGCTPCCHGPFSINALDARRLRRGLDALRAREPVLAAGIARRAREAVAALTEGFPGDPGNGLLGDDEAAEEAWCVRHYDRPCPALDPSDGHCLLYTARPMSCRTFGLPVRIGGYELPPCELCFRDAPASAIEACRVEIDPAGEEDRILDAHGLDGRDTTIAWVLARGE